MKIISFDIKNDNKLEITCKCKWYKSYLEEIDKLTYYLKAKDLNYKYLGWNFDENRNIIFTFLLRDFDKDVKPYTRNEKENIAKMGKLQQENKKLKENWNKLKEIAKSQSDFKLKCHNESLWFEVDELLNKMQELEKRK